MLKESTAMALLIASLAVCATASGARQSDTIDAPLLLPDGQHRGDVSFTDVGNGRTREDLASFGGDDGLVGSGIHDVRISAGPDCSSDVPAAYNPNHAARAPGDLPRLKLDGRGKGEYSLIVRGLTIRGSHGIAGHAVFLYQDRETDLCGTLENLR